MGCKCHDIAKSACSQTNSKSSKHSSMTPEFCKNILSQWLQTWDLRKHKSIRKISNWVEIDVSTKSPFSKLFFGNSSQKLHMEDEGLWMFTIPETNHICCMKKRRLYLKIFRNLTPKTQIQHLTIIKLKIHIIQFL